MKTIAVTEHELNGWSRMAHAAYASDRNDVGHRFSVAATLRDGDSLPLAQFDALQADYRAWIVFGEWPKS